jgi:N-acetylglucosaminyl-diphospho-decaprenol L-rhamnosyltransferase
LIMTVATGHPYGTEADSIAVVIINYNTCQELQACLGSIKPEEAAEVVVFDNNSSDGSVEMVRSKYPWVTLHANRTNLGYGAAANQAIAGCTTQYVLLLNGDTCLQPGALEALSRYLDQHLGAAIVGPRLVNSDGTRQASCYPFPGPLDTFLENSTCAIFFGRLIRRYVPGIRGLYWRTWPHDAPRIVPWVKGAALGIRREAFNAVGGFDESFFMYFEDADLCCRMKKAGWQVHFAPVTTVEHVGSASTKQVRADMAAQLLHSTDLFYHRHSSRSSIAVMSLVVKSLMLARWIGGTLRLAFTRDAKKCSAIAESIAASKKVLLGNDQPGIFVPPTM